MTIEILEYNHARDFDAVKEIWQEVGWIDTGEENEVKGLEYALEAGDCIVFPVDGVAECAVLRHTGQICYSNQDLQLGVISAVTTSRVARRMGAARKLTADTLACQAEAGCAVAALGMFDQGFYDQVGFGTGSYISRFSFDPATLNIATRFRPPKRLKREHWVQVHTAKANRKRVHGGCVLPVGTVRAELMWAETPFGLGYYDGDNGTLSHFIWGESKGEYGPYRIDAMAYQSIEQLFELLALIKSLGDQITAISMEEPAELQFQDLLSQPFRVRRSTEGSENESWHQAEAYWQARILNLEDCLAKTRLDAPTLQFNLTLTDPVAAHLLREHSWQGVGGDYVVTLGEESSAQRGTSSTLPTLQASVGAFSRIWLGVRNASSIALTDDLRGSTELLGALDRTLNMPAPCFGWDF